MTDKFDDATNKVEISSEPFIVETEKKLENNDIQQLENEFLCVDDDMHLTEAFKDQSAVFKILENSVRYDSDKINELENKINNLDFKINYYQKFMFNENLDDASQIIVPSSQEKKFPRNKYQKDASKKMELALEEISILRFDEKKFHSLPNNIEPAQLLKNLSMKMKFRSSLLKYWIPVIRSEASCAILLDSFWWCLLKYFRKDPDYSMDIYKYYCRIAENFAALYFSVDSSFRDTFFHNYAFFLTQAVYLLFYQSFPGSRLYLNENFKNELCQTIFEWVLGVRPFPEIHKTWLINDQIQSVTADSSEKNGIKASEILNKVNNLQKQLNSLNDEKPLIGKYVSLQKVGFNLKGKSVLISQYMKMYNLEELHSLPNQIGRIEMK